MNRLSIALLAALVLVLAGGTAWYWAAQAERLEAELAGVQAELAMERQAAIASATAIRQSRHESEANLTKQTGVWHALDNVDRGGAIDRAILERLREAGFSAPGTAAE